MNKTVRTFVITLIVGIVGMCLDSMLHGGSFGVVFSIATVGAFIVSSIENNRTK